MGASEVTVVRLGHGPDLALMEEGATGSATASVWPGMGAQYRTIARLSLGPASATTLLGHTSEAVYFVRSGSGIVVRSGTGEAPDDRTAVREGEIVHVGAGNAYRFSAASSDGLELLGGPCPPDPAWFSEVGDGDGAGRRAVAAVEMASAAVGTPVAETSAVVAGGIGPSAGGSTGKIQVFGIDEVALMLPLISSDARMIAWPGNGAWNATMNYVRMAPGEENTPHVHPESEDTIVILEGRGSVDDLSTGKTHEFSAGDVVHVPARVRHAVRANRGSPVVSVGGPCPADLGFLRMCGAELPDRT